MPQLPVSIMGGTAPYSIVVTEAGTGEAVVCTSGCSSNGSTTRNITFTALPGNHNYRVRITDSSTPACVQERLTGLLTCAGSSVPSYGTTVSQPICTNGALSYGKLDITNIQNGNRYAIQDGQVFTGNDCSNSVSFTGNTVSVDIVNPASGQSATHVLRVWGGTDCSLYSDSPFTLTSPVCTTGTSCTLTINIGSASC